MSFLISASVSSGRTPSFEASGECTLVDHGNGTATVSLTETVGECSITARCGAEPGLYAAAPDVTQTFQVLKRDQTITFAALANQLASGPPFDIHATATSDLPVAFAATGDCSLVDHGDGTATVTLAGIAGSGEITASQAGNPIYNAAVDVIRSFDVVDADPPPTFPYTSTCSVDTCLIIAGSGYTDFMTDPGGAFSQSAFSGQTIVNNGLLAFVLTSGTMGFNLTDDDCLTVEWCFRYVSGVGIAGAIAIEHPSGTPIRDSDDNVMYFPLGSRCKLQLDGGLIKYFVNEVLVFTSPDTVPTDTPVHLKFTSFGPGGFCRVTAFG